MIASLRTRVARAERSLPPFCPGCAGRPALPGVLFQYSGRLIDGHGNDIDPAWMTPCPVCGRGGMGSAGKVVVGADPAAVLGIRTVRGVDPACL